MCCPGWCARRGRSRSSCGSSCKPTVLKSRRLASRKCSGEGQMKAAETPGTRKICRSQRKLPSPTPAWGPMCGAQFGTAAFVSPPMVKREKQHTVAPMRWVRGELFILPCSRRKCAIETCPKTPMEARDGPGSAAEAMIPSYRLSSRLTGPATEYKRAGGTVWGV